MENKKLLKKAAAIVSAAALLVAPGMIFPESGLSISDNAITAFAASGQDIANKAINVVDKYRGDIGCGGSDDGDWCALFATSRAKQAGFTINCKKPTYCTELVCDFISQGLYTSRRTEAYYTSQSSRYVSSESLQNCCDTSYIPQPGDLIFFNWHGASEPQTDHVGIVEYARDGYVHTIEGNRAGSSYVRRYTIPLTDSTIHGYATLTGAKKKPQVKITAAYGSRARAIEEAASRFGKSYPYSISFVQEVLKASGATSFASFTNLSINSVKKDYIANGAYASASSGYVPRPGDIALLNLDEYDDADKMVLVSSVRNSEVSGFSVDGTAKSIGVINKSQLIGYIIPFYAYDDTCDIDRSGIVDSKDLNLLNSALLGDYNLSNYEFYCADGCTNGSISASDIVALNQKTAGTVLYRGSSSALSHEVGHKSGNYFNANTGTDRKSGCMIYGPYKALSSAGAKKACFTLMVDNNDAESNKVATIDVYDSTSGRVLASRDIARTEFAAPWTFQEFQLDFNCPNKTDKLEYRVRYYANVDLTFDKVVIRSN